jgi:predicted PurR-regulated permease PerM
VNLPTVLVAFAAVAVVAYLVTVVHAATTRMLAGREGQARPEDRLLSWPKWLSALVVGLLVIWFLYQVRGILLPFVLGAAIAYVLNPAIDRLERRGWPRTRALGLVFAIFLIVFVVGGLLVVPLLAAEARNLIANYQVYVEQGSRLAAEVQRLAQKWGGRLGVLPEDVRDWFGQVGARAQAYALGLLNAGLAWLKGSIGFVSLLVITPVVTFWVVRDYHYLARRVMGLLPDRQRQDVSSTLRDINRLAGSYLFGVATMACIISLYAAVVLTLAGVRFGVLLGITEGVLSVVPYLGFPTALLIIALTMLVTGAVPTKILVVLALLVGGNILTDYGLAPRIIGSRVGLHPLLVIFALLAGGALLGFIGLLLAVPLAGAIKVVLMHFWPEVVVSEPLGEGPGKPNGPSVE